MTGAQAKIKNQQNKQDIEKALNESNEILSKSDLLLRQFKIEQTELSTLFGSGQLLINNLETNSLARLILVSPL